MSKRPNFQPCLAIDIGGMNLKVCHGDAHGQLRAFSQRFVMCHQIDELDDALKKIAEQCDPIPACWLVTLTGELCDCFIHRKQGVERILGTVKSVAGDTPVQVWSTTGQFVSIESALKQYERVASANWHALGTWAGLSFLQQRVLLLDTGSTTTDLIPVLRGQVVARGLTDAARLEQGELLYLGASQTPLMAVGLTDPKRQMIREWFANMQDVAVLMGFCAEDASQCDTPDGEPLTARACARRVLRMVGRDLLDDSDMGDACGLARAFLDSAITQLAKAMCHPLQSHGPIDQVLLSGSGSWLLKQMMQQHFSELKYIELNAIWEPTLSTAACATAMIKVYTHRQ